MIILKAEGTLAAVFHKTIKVMEQNVEWNETFAINNNTLILPGTCLLYTSPSPRD